MKSEPTSFLYPFIDSEETDTSALVADLSASARSKMAQSRELRARTLESLGPAVDLAAGEMAVRFSSGGRLFAFGNGGSATDAESAVQLFREPSVGVPLPAISLVGDRAVLTALANDVGFEVVFSRQIIAHARPVDVAMGFSTSGDSKNVIKALKEASGRGLLTVGFSGYEGGEMGQSPYVSHSFVVGSQSVHRIQEAQSALLLGLHEAVQRALGEGRTA